MQKNKILSRENSACKSERKKRIWPAHMPDLFGHVKSVMPMTYPKELWCPIGKQI